MWASGCRENGHFNMTCDPSPEVIARMVAWATARQNAIDDARSQTPHANVDVVLYIEVHTKCAHNTQSAQHTGTNTNAQMNLGPEAVAGKPGVTNDVLGKVNPDLVSYSSYSATNAYANAETPAQVAAAEKEFHEVLSYVNSSLPPKHHVPWRLRLQSRLLIGEYGVSRSAYQTAARNERFVRDVCKGALRWGVAFVLYWAFYDTEGKRMCFVDERDNKTEVRQRRMGK